MWQVSGFLRVSSTKKTEILLKVALITIKPNQNQGFTSISFLTNTMFVLREYILNLFIYHFTVDYVNSLFTSFRKLINH
jgi:hypothetical protein